MSTQFTTRSPRGGAVLLIWLVLIAAAGCGSHPHLMPTPTAYTRPDWNPFDDVPPALQGNRVPVLYITDRRPENDSPDKRIYGTRRSRSAAFGVCEMQIGPDGLPWDKLVEASRTARRAEPLNLSVVSTRELGRFAPTPPYLVMTDAELAQTRPADPTTQDEREAERRFIEELTSRLAATPTKEVLLYVHGFDNTLDDSVYTAGELWHFLGRRGVPVAYSWPAGLGGLRAYQYTRESGQFTTYHLKQALRLIASCPAVEKVDIVAHSRGTDVAAMAVRELHIETRDHADTRTTFKFGKVVLAAADIDIDVFFQRMGTERVARAVDSVAVYACKRDKALGLSGWLVGGYMRVGDVTPSVFTPEELHRLRESRRLQFIDARVTDRGSYGHNYFHANPSVSSDLVLYLRYGLPPGGEFGRPLGTSEKGLWVIDDKYPGPGDSSWFAAIRGQKTTAKAEPGASP